MTKEEFLEQFPALVPGYQPSSSTLSQVRQTSLVMVVGPSGSGKTTLINSLKLPQVLVDTTRDLRPGEVDGKDIYHISNYEKAMEEIKAGNFVQIIVGVSGDFYGTKPTSYPSGSVALMPVLADVVPLFRSIGFKSTVTIFITPPTYLEWMKRLGTHSMDAGLLDRRLAEAYRSFDFALKDQQTHFILNDEVDKAVFQINELIINSKVQNVRELTARVATEEIFSHLK